MHITTVNLGQVEPVQIVCGAPNVAAGQKVVVATLGAKLYDGDECFTIKKSKLRVCTWCGFTITNFMFFSPMNCPRSNQ